MRAIAIPFVGQPVPADRSPAQKQRRPLLSVLLGLLDRLVPPHDPARPSEPPPEWYRFPPF